MPSNLGKNFSSSIFDTSRSERFNFAFDCAKARAGDEPRLRGGGGKSFSRILPSPPLPTRPPYPLKFPPRPYNKLAALLVDKGYKRGGNYADKMLVQSEQNR